MIPNPPVFTVLVMDDFNTRYTHLKLKISLRTPADIRVMNMHSLFSIGIQ